MPKYLRRRRCLLTLAPKASGVFGLFLGKEAINKFVF